MTNKLCFLSKGDRPDKKETVQLLMTRLKGPYMYNHKNLELFVKYMRGYSETTLTLKTDNTYVVEWWVYAKFSVHTDMKIHTGSKISLGKGLIQSTSLIQNYNKRGSKEAEMLGVKYITPMILCN